MRSALAIWLAVWLGASAAAADDTMARRARACTGCHGEQGRAAPDGYHPRIAGKPAAYLFDQLQAFRDGRRHYALMTALLDPLDDAMLRALAEHFAALDLPYAAPLPATASPETLRRGEVLARQGDPAARLPACASCHGRQLTGTLPGVPSLLGLPRDYLIAQLGAWRTGTRRSRAPDCMAEVTRRLAPADIGALAQWLAAQPVPVPSRAAARPEVEPPLRCGAMPAQPG